jgi:opacity protein-like surface antigen
LPVCSYAQAGPAAYVKRHSIYVGAEYSLYNSDYFGDNKSLNTGAFTVYGDYYLTNGAWPITLDVNFTKVLDHHGYQQRDISSLIAGPMVRHRFGRFEPFAKVGAGVGHFTSAVVHDYRQDGQHFAIGFGGGLDYRLTSRITLRPLDYTYERWNFAPNALSPSMLGFGISYRIH